MKLCKALVIILASVFLLTGCWDAMELEDQFLVWAMCWDVAKEEVETDKEIVEKKEAEKKVESQNMQEEKSSGEKEENKSSKKEKSTEQTKPTSKTSKLTVSLTSPSTMEGAPKPYDFVTATGYSVEQAIANIQSRIFRGIELGHLRILIISEEFAKKGILKHLDSLGRNPRVGRDIIIAVIKGSTDQVRDLKNPNDPYPGDYIVQLIKTNARYNESAEVTFRDFFEAISQEGMEPVAPYLVINKDKSGFNANNLAVFKNDKMVGYLEDIGLEYYLILANRSREGSMTLGKATLPSGNATTFVYRRSSTEVKTKIINNEPHIYLKVKAEGDISEYTSKKPTRSQQTIKEVQKDLEKAAKEEMYRLIKKFQQDFKSDNFGFGSYFRALQPKWWNSHKWEEEFPKAKIHIEVKFNIRRVGIEN